MGRKQYIVDGYGQRHAATAKQINEISGSIRRIIAFTKKSYAEYKRKTGEKEVNK